MHYARLGIAADWVVVPEAEELYRIRLFPAIKKKETKKWRGPSEQFAVTQSTLQCAREIRYHGLQFCSR